MPAAILWVFLPPAGNVSVNSVNGFLSEDRVVMPEIFYSRPCVDFHPGIRIGIDDEENHHMRYAVSLSQGRLRKPSRAIERSDCLPLPRHEFTPAVILWFGAGVFHRMNIKRIVIMKPKTGRVNDEGARKPRSGFVRKSINRDWLGYKQRWHIVRGENVTKLLPHFQQRPGM